MKQMLTHPGTLHVWGEGDGVCEGKRERGTGNGYRDMVHDWEK